MPDEHPADLLPIRVRILDREYPLKVRAEDEGFTRRLAEELHERLTALRHQIPNQPDLTLAVLAAMRLSEEVALRDREIERLRASVAAQAEALVERLDMAMAGGA